MEQEFPPHQHMPYGRVHQTEHFDVLIKRCRICDEFVGIETAERKDKPKQQPPEPGAHFDQYA